MGREKAPAKRPPTFVVPLRQTTADKLRAFCKRERISQTDLCQLVLEWMMGLDRTTLHTVLDQLKREDRPRVALVVLERLAATDPHAADLAREALQRLSSSDRG